MKKEEIYEKSLRLFLDRGFDNTPMSLIAKELGLSKGGLFHHFASKEKLLYEIIEHILENDLVPILENAEKIADSKERITYFVRNYTKLLANDNGARVVLHESGRLQPNHYWKIRGIWKRIYALLSNALSELQGSGEGKPLNKAFSAFAALGMCTWTFYWFDYSRKGSAEELAETFVEIFLKGFLRGD